LSYSKEDFVKWVIGIQSELDVTSGEEEFRKLTVIILDFSVEVEEEEG
jgi:hypothetical protein